MNAHPVGQMVYRRLIQGLGTGVGDSGPGGAGGDGMGGVDWRNHLRLTLLAMPLVPDHLTRRIASGVSRIVNLPVDSRQAWLLVQSLNLDILIFPDWQPFPDQGSVLFMNRRVAPVQICLFVRGASCAGVGVDYYLLPEEAEGAFLQAQVASDIHAKVVVTLPKGYAGPSGAGMGPGAVGAGTGTGAGPMVRQVRRSLRPQWREFFCEQVVLLDWPLLTPQLVRSIASQLPDDVPRGPAEGARGTGVGGAGGEGGAGGGGLGGGGLGGGLGGVDSDLFSPLETEGRVFFEGQPVAILPLHPTSIHPLMDDVLFKLLRAVPSLHVVLALPEAFFSHATDKKHKISWARRLVRRLWSRGGPLFHRIRLLPAPMSDRRLSQLLRQADMVLDSFPLGGSFYLLALALSVGTPVITLDSGVKLHSSREDLREMRLFLAQARVKRQKAEAGTGGEMGAGAGNGTVLHSSELNPMTQLLSHSDLPWAPAVSAVAGFYRQCGLDAHFVANSTAQYFRLATQLAEDREAAYALRVRLLEAVDGNAGGAGGGGGGGEGGGGGGGGDGVANSGTSGKSASNSNSADSGSTGGEDWDEFAETGAGTPPTTPSSTSTTSASTSTTSSGSGSGSGCSHCVDDLGRFLLSTGLPYARARAWGGQGCVGGEDRRRAARREGRLVREGEGGAEEGHHGSGAIS
ncbi:hypothetical protein B484DRAFT_415662 [Ochromonadaceae sp. CCMP2298]|nr:hypothetical protein B484DRAFT_415662 [Ochromonadaceae sp. CCMP2298]